MQNKPANMYLPEINGIGVTLTSVYKYEFNTWKLKEELVLTPYQIGDILIKNIVKVKIYRNEPINQHYLLKVTQKKTQSDIIQHQYAIFKQNHQFFYYKLITFKLQSMQIQFVKNQQFMNLCESNCYKKSEVLKKWEERYLMITYTDGLMSGKGKQLGPTLQINNTKQIWSRFQILEMENRKFIVIKLKYGIIKEQFGVPIQNAIKWFKAFYSLFLN